MPRSISCVVTCGTLPTIETTATGNPLLVVRRFLNTVLVRAPGPGLRLRAAA
ncbi:hypothetical protein [Streptomyces roseifaciens]|uniref:hypothetical protein n=1 Tax=Streptomyces roseifaciens TaxID=1488406 RepID=UPI000AF37E4B|nr:hypothetical protein [Streptomyces roseifaciens]